MAQPRACARHGLRPEDRSADGAEAYHGIEPPAVPFGSVKVATDPTQDAAAQAHLEAALKSYRQALELNKDDLIVRLSV